MFGKKEVWRVEKVTLFVKATHFLLLRADDELKRDTARGTS